ncbi:MAG: DctP family TRAP transporter solute-binding subunit [Candidatus Magnetominusculus sp. LBB02]|nr:DctP family TRAP transporter solute-binding subunit [Candidatus Magnetominusculus sp. LBB02]
MMAKNALLKAALIAVAAVAALSLFSCKPKTPAAVTEKKVYQLGFGHNMPQGSAMDIAAKRFAEVVQQKTNGSVVITVHPNQTLANDYKMIEMAIDGELDILLSPTAKMSAVAPAMQYSDIPFLFPHKDDVYAMLDGATGKMLLEQLGQFGLVGAAFWGNGFKQFTANKEIHSPKDFKGMSVRVMSSPLIMDQFRAFNANPIAIDFHETYKALKDGGVKAQENPISVIYDMKFHEVQSNITISSHAYLAYVLCFSKRNFDKLPPDIQQALMTTAKELTGYERELIENQESDMLKKIEASGVKVAYLTDDETEKFRLAVNGILYKYTPVIGNEIIEATLDYLKQKYHRVAVDQILIGLNADMMLATAQTGTAIERGMKLAANEINERGGLLGRRLVVVTMDHSGNALRSVANITLFSKMEGLVAVMGGLQSQIALSNLKSIHLNKIIYLIPWAAHPEIVKNNYTPNFVFRLSANDAFTGPFLVKEALKKTRKIALVRVNSVWGAKNEEIMVHYLKGHGLKFTTIEIYNENDKDFYAQIERTSRSGAEAIILIATGSDGANIINALFYSKKKIPVIAHRSLIGGNIFNDIKTALSAVDLSFMQTYSFITAASSKTKEFVNRYMTDYGVKSAREIPSPEATANAYDLVMLLAEAVRQSGTIDTEAVRDEMEKIQRYDGLTKTHTPPFTKDRHDALDETGYFMAKFDGSGAIIPIEEGKK